MPNHDPPLTPVESALAQLRLAPPRISPEQLCYAAGIAAGRRQLLRWRSAAALFALATAASLLHHTQPPSPLIAQQSQPPAATTFADSIDPTVTQTSYSQMSQLVLREGWQSLSPPPSTGHPIDPTFHPRNE